MEVLSERENGLYVAHTPSSYGHENCAGGGGMMVGGVSVVSVVSATVSISSSSATAEIISSCAPLSGERIGGGASPNTVTLLANDT